ncbi:MAG: hypothetical protein Q7V31_03740 [Parvibaculum sp.]|uniref:DUF7210 family protein n=1 Tax=Parvibaculum sp. TaxID=2024848 RepID=UPI00271E4EE2|nr:hypothetical protein [Parvibaculum sp.]MDO8838015.1 hypothetical protein [Parvibaculum sp.]
MAKKKANTETATYEVLTRIRHDGDRYVAGDEIELTAAQHAQLAKSGAVSREPVGDTADADAKAKAEAEAKAKAEAEAAAAKAEADAKAKAAAAAGAKNKDGAKK